MTLNRHPIHTSFRSDNDAGASPQILQALLDCNAGPAYPYGADICTQQVEARLNELFGREVRVLLVNTGTAANSLALSAMSPPWGSVLCHRLAHVHTDECGAPEFFGAGLKLVPSVSPGDRIDPGILATELQRGRGDVHAVQPSGVTITQSTESGQVYSPEEVAAIGSICHAAGVPLHMDGARFANALVALGCTPADLTWKSGVDLLSFGATKNGALNAEALIVFRESLWETLPFRRKRSGHLLSKMRFVSAQMRAYLADDLWLANARHANAMGQRLSSGLAALRGVQLQAETRTNMMFAKLPEPMLQGLLRQGFDFYHGGRFDNGVARLVTSFCTTPQQVDALLAAARDLQSPV